MAVGGNDKESQARLADICMQNVKWSAMADVSNWDNDITFFLATLDSKNKEIRKLRAANKNQKKVIANLICEMDLMSRRISACRI